MNLERLVFIDESGAKTNMTRLYGRAKEGQRAVDDAPSGHWCTTTMISSVRLDGSTACMVVDGATTKDIFNYEVRLLGWGGIILIVRFHLRIVHMTIYPFTMKCD